MYRDRAIEYMSLLMGRPIESGCPIVDQNIDSLAMLDWLFFVEEMHCFAITSQFIEAIDIKSTSLEQLYDQVMAASANFDAI
jgi:hypothetical protein